MKIPPCIPLGFIWMMAVHWAACPTIATAGSSPVANVNVYPYNTVGRVASNGNLVGSGVAVGLRTVLTVAHNMETSVWTGSRYQHDLTGGNRINDLLDVPAGEVAWYWKYSDQDERKRSYQFSDWMDGTGKVLAPEDPKKAEGKLLARYVVYPTNYAAVVNDPRYNDPARHFYDTEIWNRDVAVLGFLQNCTNGVDRASYFTSASESKILESEGSFFGLDAFCQDYYKMMAGYPFAYVNVWSVFTNGRIPPIASMKTRGVMHATDPGFHEAFVNTLARVFWDPSTDDLGMRIHTYKGPVFGWIGHSGSPLFIKAKGSNVPEGQKKWNVAGVYVFATRKGVTGFGDLTPGGLLSAAVEVWGVFRAIDTSLSAAITRVESSTRTLTNPGNDHRQDTRLLTSSQSDLGAGRPLSGGSSSQAGPYALYRQSNQRATVQAGEPAHADSVPVGRTVWYLLPIKGRGEVTVRVSNTFFRPALAIYKTAPWGGERLLGNRVGSVVAAGPGQALETKFRPEAGQDFYYIVVGGVNNEQGQFDLTASQLPDARPIATMGARPTSPAETGREYSFTVSAIDAEQTLRGLHLLLNGQRVGGVDYASDMPSGTYTLNFKTNARGTLRFSAEGVDAVGNRGVSSDVPITFAPPAGSTDVFESDSFAGAGWLADGDNDGEISAPGSLWLATTEPGETAVASDSKGTVWYRWTAPASGFLQVRADGMNRSHEVAVFTGSTLSTLRRVSSNYVIFDYDSTLQVRVQRNENYAIRVADLYRQGGDFDLKLRFIASNMAPTAQDSAFTVDKDLPRKMLLGGSDPEGDPLTWQLTSPPVHGSLSASSGVLDDGGMPVYTPQTGYEGADEFQFTVADVEAGSAVTGKVSLLVRDPLRGGAIDATFTQNVETIPTDEPVGFYAQKHWVGAADGKVLHVPERLPLFYDSGAAAFLNVFDANGQPVLPAAGFLDANGVSRAKLNGIHVSNDQGTMVVLGLFDRATLDGTYFTGGDINDTNTGYGVAVFENGVRRPTAGLPRPAGINSGYPREAEALCAAFQVDGKILVGGIAGESNLSGARYRARGFLRRLVRTEEGGLIRYEWDNTFAPGTAITSPVQDVVSGGNGKVHVLLRGFPYLLRLNEDGSRDTSFTPPSVWSGPMTPSMIEVADPGPGAPGYDYEIGTHEVTNQQYTAFLNAVAASDQQGLYDPRIGSEPEGGIARSGSPGGYRYATKPGKEQHPVVFVGVWDAVRFVNWLQNGGLPGADTENGAYRIAGGQDHLTRLPGAVWFLPNGAEWDKAAYYEPSPVGPGTGRNWTYPYLSDNAPVPEPPPGGANSANFYDSLEKIMPVGGLNDVGAYFLSRSPWGTFGQGGNASEIYEGDSVSADPSASVPIKGGAWDDALGNMEFGNSNEQPARGAVGFRVASIQGRNPIRDIELAPPAADGSQQLIVAGSFTRLGGQPRPGVARLSVSGALDAAFAPTATFDNRQKRMVCLKAVQTLADGSVLVGGEFEAPDGSLRGDIMRLNPNGTVHPGFQLDPQSAMTIDSIALDLPKAMVVVGGRMQPTPYASTGQVDYRPVARFHLGNKLPLVALANLPAGSEIAMGGSILLSAQASDPDGTIRAVRFYVNGNLVGESTAQPYMIRWTVPPETGFGDSISICAEAEDNLGGRGRTEWVDFTARDSGGIMPGEMLMAETLAHSTGVDPEGWNHIDVEEGGFVPLHVAQADLQGRFMAHEITQPPLNGALSGNPGSWTYRPNPDFSGRDEVVVRSLNLLGDEVLTKFAIDVSNTPDAPVAREGTFALTEDTELLITPVVGDADGDTIELQIMTPPLHGTAVVEGVSIRYAPAAGYVGADSILYRASDGTLVSPSATLALAVQPAALPPPLPIQVTGAKATDGLPSGVLVSWNELNTADSYEVWRGTSPSMADKQLVGNSTAKNFNDTTAPSGVVLYYTVAAKAGNEAGPASLPAMGTRGMSPPATVSATKGSNPTRVVITWGACDAAVAYEVYARAVPGSSSALLGTVNGATTYDHTAAVPGTRYEYRVKSIGSYKARVSALSVAADEGWVQATVTPVAGAGGSISPNLPQRADAGGSVDFQASPEPGYAVSAWIVNGSTKKTNGNRYTISNITRNTSVEVRFARVDLSLTLSPTTATDGRRKGVFRAGDTVVLTLKAANPGSVPVEAEVALQIARNDDHGSVLWEQRKALSKGLLVRKSNPDSLVFQWRVPSGTSPGQYDIRAVLRDPSGSPVYEDTEAGPGTLAFGESAWLRGFNVIRRGDGQAEHYALFFGDGEATGDPGDKDFGDFQYEVESGIEALAKTLTDDTTRWTHNRIIRLVNQQATVPAITAGIETLGASMDADDVLFVYCLGHGIAGNGVKVRGTSGLSYYSPRKMDEDLADYISGGVEKIVFVDTNYSGMFVDWFKSRKIGQIQVMATCRARDMASSKTRDGWPVAGRVVNHYFCTALAGGADIEANHDGITSIGEIYDYLGRHVPNGALARQVRLQRYPEPGVLDTTALSGVIQGPGPTLAFTAPSADLVIRAGQAVTIHWSDGDTDSNARISLATDLDPGNEPWTVGSQQWLAVDLLENAEGAAGSFVWDTSGVQPGTYSIWGVISDGLHAPVYSRAIGRVTVAGEYAVGQFVDIDLSGFGNVVSVGGVPSGMSFNSSTKHLVGRPNKGGSVAATVNVRQSDGKVVGRPLAANIEALPSWASGAFTAMIVPPSPSDTTLVGLGGILRLDISDSGVFSGTLRLGGKSYSLRSRLAGVTAFERGMEPLRHQMLIQTESASPDNDITLDLAFSPEDAADAPGLTGWLTYKNVTLQIGPGWKHVWNSQTNPAWGNKDRTLNVLIAGAGTGGPGGQGFATVKLFKSGQVTWSGTLSDGQNFSGSFVATPDGDLPLYVPLPYKGGGCVTALLQTTMADDLIRVAPSAVANGRWIKLLSAGTTDRSYPGGFDLNLFIHGAEYNTPGTGQWLFGSDWVPQSLKLRMQGARVDETTTFAPFVLGGAVLLDAELRGSNSLAITQVGLPRAFSVSFSPGSGRFSAETKLSDFVDGTIVERPLLLRAS